jgi:hypothetical protein
MDNDQTQNRLRSIGVQLFLATLLIAGASAYVAKNKISTVFKAGSEEKEITVAFFPNTISAASGQSFSMTPFLTAHGKKPNVVTLTLGYDGTKLKFENAEDAHVDGTLETLLPAADGTKPTDGTMRYLRLSYGVKDTANPPGESIELSKLTFSVIDGAQTSLTVDPARSQMVFADEDTAVILGETVQVNTQTQVQEGSTDVVADPTVSPETSGIPTEETAEPKE